LGTTVVSTIALPVVACPTTYGFPTPPQPSAYPNRITLSLPDHLGSSLAYYSDKYRKLPPILGPRGWRCAVAYGADGTTGVDVWPPGASQTASAIPGRPAVSAGWDSACQGCVYSSVCAFVPGAAKQLGYADGGIPCRSRPEDETVTWLSGSPTSPGPVVSDTVAFQDPSSPDPIHGLLLYRYGPTAGSGGRASQELCTLPEVDHQWCTAILDDFRSRDWLMRS
jgi:hypothetical protein